MSSQDIHQSNYGNGAQNGKTIDLQGVAAFAGLVELLAQELGTSPGRMQGHLPNGPAAFNQLIGEIELNNQGFQRKLTLLSQPGTPLTMRFESHVHDSRLGETRTTPGGEKQTIGIVADYYISAAVEDIVPQGRALARYCEDIFSTLDRMVTLGLSNKLMGMSVSSAELTALEYGESGSLVRPRVAGGPAVAE